MPAAQTQEAQTPGLSAKDAVTVTATVEAIDLETRQVTLRGPEGNRVTLTVGEEVRNLPQIKVGDRVVAQYVEGLALELGPKGKGIRQRYERMDVQRAQPGQKPAGVLTRTVDAVGTVEAIDREARTVKVRGTERTLTLKAADKVDLSQIKVGDEVYASYIESLAISVLPAAAQQGVE
jgi:Cu/Ag efflux protein CusF